MASEWSNATKRTSKHHCTIPLITLATKIFLYREYIYNFVYEDI